MNPDDLKILLADHGIWMTNQDLTSVRFAALANKLQMVRTAPVIEMQFSVCGGVMTAVLAKMGSLTVDAANFSAQDCMDTYERADRSPDWIKGAQYALERFAAHLSGEEKDRG